VTTTPQPLRPVTIEEMKGHAASSCRPCQSSGVLTTLVRVHREKRGGKGTAVPVPKDRQRVSCPCTLRGFLRAHGADVVADEKGRLWWRAAGEVV